MTVRAPTLISCGAKPRNEYTSTASLPGTVMEYRPFPSVRVATVAPFTVTLTPGRGSLLSSSTVPVMVLCATAITGSSSVSSSIIPSLPRNLLTVGRRLDFALLRST